MTAGEDQIKRAEAAIEAFDPSQPLRERKFQWPDAGGNLREVIYTQGPLGHFPTQELGLIITKLAKGVMDGKYGVDVMQLVKDRQRLTAASLPDELSTDAVEQTFSQWRPYIEAFLSIMQEVPDLEQEIIALSLGVRRRDRVEFKERISEAPHMGGLTNDEAVDIIKVFIRQNVVAIRRFLGEQVQEIWETFTEAIDETVRASQEDEGSNGGMPSSTSSAPIQA